MNNDYSERARALVGTRFRPQGRSHATGFDCVGLALEVFGIASDAVRGNYGLRGDHAPELKQQIARFFRRVAKAAAAPGDLMLSAVGDGQVHLSIRTTNGFVHADARLGRVVETPGCQPWPCLGAYRRRVQIRGR